MRSWLRGGLAAVLAAVVAASAAPAVAGAPADDEGEIRVFLCTSSMEGCHKRAATGRQKKALRAFLEGLPELEEVRFVDRARMYADFRNEFATVGSLMEQVREKDLPEAFVLRVEAGVDRKRLTESLWGRPGVGRAFDVSELRRDPSILVGEWDMNINLCTKDSQAHECRSGRGRANKKAVTAREKKAIVAAIDGSPEVLSYAFEDQKTAWRAFKEAFADNKALLSATRVSDMPMSYRLRVRPEADSGTLMTRFTRLPGVSTVDSLRCLQVTFTLGMEYGLDAEGLDDGACGSAGA
ncbi:permease-like cell division protein FtsX [Nonomuraea sp. NPDC050783]|uniref:permease-like cell division protein FtsX n=1 Tax=Nonomuraea sp. NPDC050783 TaxID=3154634 RepID=UPI0034675D0C